jgi:hypothetical protein
VPKDDHRHLAGLEDDGRREDVERLVAGGGWCTAAAPHGLVRRQREGRAARERDRDHEAGVGLGEDRPADGALRCRAPDGAESGGGGKSFWETCRARGGRRLPLKNWWQGFRYVRGQVHGRGNQPWWLGATFSAGAASRPTLDILREIYGRRYLPKRPHGQHQDALQVSTVFACARVIGNGMAQVPLKLMRETIDASGRTTRLPAKDHPLYDLLARRPNPWQTSFEFRQVMSWHVELAATSTRSRTRPSVDLRADPVRAGRGDREARGRRHALIVRSAAKLARVQEFPAEAIWHVRGPAGTAGRGSRWLQARARRDRPDDRDGRVAGLAAQERRADVGVYSVEGKLKRGAVRRAAQVDREGARRRGAAPACR